jgi:hypothetical protein
VIAVCIDKDTYATTIAALKVAARCAERSKAPQLAERFRAAHDDLRRSYTLANDDGLAPLPSLLRRQAE